LAAGLTDFPPGVQCGCQLLGKRGRHGYKVIMSAKCKAWVNSEKRLGFRAAPWAIFWGTLPVVCAIVQAWGAAVLLAAVLGIESAPPGVAITVFALAALLRAGAQRDLEACLAAELALVTRIIRLPDFAEGVRAMVVDKDRAPRWQPARIEDVDPRLIADLVPDPA